MLRLRGRDLETSSQSSKWTEQLIILQSRLRTRYVTIFDFLDCVSIQPSPLREEKVRWYIIHAFTILTRADHCCVRRKIAWTSNFHWPDRLFSSEEDRQQGALSLARYVRFLRPDSSVPLQRIRFSRLVGRFASSSSDKQFLFTLLSLYRGVGRGSIA